MKPKDIFPKYKHLGNGSLFFRLPRWHSGYKICLLIQEMRVQSLGQEDPLEKEMAAHSSILAWKNPKNKGAWWATVHGLQTVRHDLVTKHTCTHVSVFNLRIWNADSMLRAILVITEHLVANLKIVEGENEFPAQGYRTSYRISTARWMWRT